MRTLTDGELEGCKPCLGLWLPQTQENQLLLLVGCMVLGTLTAPWVSFLEKPAGTRLTPSLDQAPKSHQIVSQWGSWTHGCYTCIQNLNN